MWGWGWVKKDFPEVKLETRQELAKLRWTGRASHLREQSGHKVREVGILNQDTSVDRKHEQKSLPREQKLALGRQICTQHKGV